MEGSFPPAMITVDLGSLAAPAHLVFEAEQRRAVFWIDDVEETILVLVAFLGDQAAFQQAAVRP